MAYDRRHGWRGPLARISPDAGRPRCRPLESRGWRQCRRPPGLPGMAARRRARGRTRPAPPSASATAQPADPHGRARLGARLARRNRRRADTAPPRGCAGRGDVVAGRAGRSGGGRPAGGRRSRSARLPEVERRLVALDPHTGRVLALAGGCQRTAAEFNRATQAGASPARPSSRSSTSLRSERRHAPAADLWTMPFVDRPGAGAAPWTADQLHGER